MNIVEEYLEKIEELEKGKHLRELRSLREEAATNLKNARTQLIQLAEDEKVKTYIEQREIASKLSEELPKLDLEIRKEEMTNCEHIWITSGMTVDSDPGHQTRRYYSHSCIKCGLDTYAKARAYDRTFSTKLDWIMVGVLEKTGEGIRTDITCSHDLAAGIYKGILKAYPEITDEQAVQYLKYALHSIRTNKVSDGVKEKRVKRLGLRPNFDKWNGMVCR